MKLRTAVKTFLSYISLRSPDAPTDEVCRDGSCDHCVSEEARWNSPAIALPVMSDEELRAYCWRNVKALDPIKVSAASMMLFKKFSEEPMFLKELIERITENRTGWLFGRPDQECWYCGGDGRANDRSQPIDCPICEGSGRAHEMGLHHGWGTAIRNLLRKEGFGEAYFGIDNLDDFYSVLVELACGFQAPEGV